MTRLLALLLLLPLLWVTGVAAQEDAAVRTPPPPPASLIADRIRVEGSTQIVAEGNVEVVQGDQRLMASRVVFDNTTGELTIEGPIRIEDGGDILLLASAAQLDADLRNGLLRSARLVLYQQLQIAAAEIARVDGRYTQLYKTVASSCQVCANNPTPLWQIRARRVIHDEVERQLYFDDAQFRVLGIPVFYFPRLRLPDPSLTRSSGFLIPSIRTTDTLGIGLKVPYFVSIGDTSDLLITPYFSTSATRTLEGRYRRSYGRGTLEFSGAITRDDLDPGAPGSGADDLGRDETRWYLFGEGTYALANDYKLAFDIEAVSDDDYRLDYAYFEKDRLDSEVELSRTRRSTYFVARITAFDSLRGPEDDDSPTLFSELVYDRRYTDPVFGGDIGLNLSLMGVGRSEDDPTVAQALDTFRASAAIDWRKGWTFGPGLQAEAAAALYVDRYSVQQDPTLPSTTSRAIPYGGVTLRWPFEKTERNGARQVLEPIVQVVWSGDDIDDAPNEDSQLVEFDEATLFDFTRFPGRDVHETGWRANIGARWTRHAPSGLSYGVTAGRVVRLEEEDAFSEGSGLAGLSSDWLISGELRFANRIHLQNRALFDESLAFTKNETRLDWVGDRFGISTTYLYLDSEPAEDRFENTSEWRIDARYALTDRWTAEADLRRDFNTNQTTEAGLSLEYRSECITVDLSVSRRFTSATSSTTDFGVAVSLTGFGTGAQRSGGYRRCSS